MPPEPTDQPISDSTARHRAEAKRRGPIACAVITVSDTRTPETDKGGALVQEHLRAAGHEIVEYRIVRDEAEAIGRALTQIRETGRAQAVILTGGTGIAARDVTPEAVAGLLDRKIEGFGELFRMLSWQEIGAAAMLSRAVGGLMGGVVILAIPGSTAAVRLAMEKLIVPELEHLVYEAAK